jgi:hypothetical protein
MNDQPNENRVIELPNKKQLNDQRFIVKDNKFYRPNTLESCLDRGSIDHNQFTAGMIHFADAHFGLIFSGLKGIDTTRAALPRIKGWKPSEMTTDQAYAHKNWSDAFYLEALGDEDRRVLLHIVILDHSTSSYSDNRAHTIGTLRIALNELARHYRHKRRM